jgi:hypothetical protein
MSKKSTNSIKTLQIEDLVPDPRNARSHPIENQEAIEASLKRFGAARSIVVDSEGVVRAGSGTIEAAKKLGYKKIKIVESDGKELVAVYRPDWTEEEAIGYGIADNRTAELADWDLDVLKSLTDDLNEVSLEDLGFSENDLNLILNTNDENNSNDFSDNLDVIDSVFKIVILCDDEEDQAKKLEEFESRNIKCQALML